MYGIVSKNMKYFNCLTKSENAAIIYELLDDIMNDWRFRLLHRNSLSKFTAPQLIYQFDGWFFWSRFFQAFRVNIVYLSLFIDVDLVGSFQVSY